MNQKSFFKSFFFKKKKRKKRKKEKKNKKNKIQLEIQKRNDVKNKEDISFMPLIPSVLTKMINNHGILFIMRMS